jgi:hypothetical protein
MLSTLSPQNSKRSSIAIKLRNRMSASCVPIHPRKPQSAKRPRIAASNIESGIRGGRKVQSLRVAPGKIIKAQTMLVEGCSQREISRVLEMSPHTVAKLIKTEDFQNYIRSKREELFGIVPLALESLRARVTTDPHLAYVFLKDFYGFGWSPDGKKLLVSRGHIESDVVLLRDTGTASH